MTDSVDYEPRRGETESGLTLVRPDAAAIQRRLREAEVFFTRIELDAILSVYGRKVAEGEWRDYAMGGFREVAIFSVFRRASEMPLYRIEKRPKLARKQGAYAVVAATGLILKRGHDLKQVLKVFDRRALRLVDA
ncbi:DUF2794 domain-containing protein [Parvibaculum sp.]|uniref:DUF2794 domain-containing protein n=1 Tax=Parvibaculum sp. TaxID=2024848 RepID=UPI0034A08EBB